LKKKKQSSKAVIYASSLGIEIALSIGIGGYFGFWLDKKFDTEPWLLLLFFLFGIGAAIKSLIRFIKIVEKEDRENPTIYTDKDNLYKQEEIKEKEKNKNKNKKK